MADLALNVVGELLKFVGSQAKEEVGLLWNFKDDLNEMKEKLDMVKAVLQDAESQSNHKEDVRLWLAKLKDACYDIQDMLEQYMLEYREQNGHQQLGCVVPVKVCIRNLHSRIVLAHKMKNMRERLHNIAKLKNEFALKENTVLDVQIIDKNRETFSKQGRVVLGRDEEQRDIVNLIINNQTREEIFVIPILGMGGIGKTTLAQSIFNDSRLRDSKHFDLWAWAYVSVEFDLYNIGSRIISSLRNSEINMHNLENISQELKKEVTGKRFLIVLDDVWTVDMDRWMKLIDLLFDSSKDNNKLIDRSKGSTIIVTTRIQKTATDIASNVPYRLNTLSEDNCILLFQQNAFKSEEMNKYVTLVEIGKDIAKKCRGVALVAIALGSMLRSERDEKLWSYVRDSEIWQLHEENILDSSNNSILSGLLLSYNLMPAKLKPCFAYCSTYPKGHEISSQKLVQHWISLNFVRSDSSHNNSLTLHDIAQEHLDKLISLSFLQRSESTDQFQNNFVLMHDLMHDLARHVAKNHDIEIVGDKNDPHGANINSPRYISIYDGNEIDVVDGKVRAISLHSHDVKLKDNSFSRAKSLRVLEAEGHKINLPKKLKQLFYLSASHIPDEISLPNLQFLHLDEAQFEALPGSIGNFKTLLYLDLSSCKNLATLPASIGNLQKLSHLSLRGCKNLKELPEFCFGNLKSLQYLNFSYCENLQTLPDSIVDLQRLLHLDLSYCSQLKKLPEHFSNLKNLERLVLHTSDQVQEYLLDLTSLRHLELSSNSKTLSTSSTKLIRRLTKFETLDLNHLDITIKEEEEDAEEGEEGMKHYCCNIICLENLNMLLSRLTLRGLEKVKDPKDAERANLKEKQRVRYLKLVWNGDDLDDDNAADVVLQNLRPSPKLEVLKISGYRGRQWPTWITDQPIRHLTLRDIQHDRLIQLGSMSCLVHLHLKHICLKKIEFLDPALFPSLSCFSIQKMQNLEQVLLTNFVGKSRLDINKSLTGISLLPSTRSLEDEGHVLQLAPIIQAYNSYSYYYHHYEVTCLLEETCLHIEDCPCLTQISLPPSITCLELEGDVGLVTSPAGTIEASSLENLEIWGCDQLVALPECFGKLSSLKKLHIFRCPNIHSLPNSMRQLTQLHNLTVKGCSLAFEQESKHWSPIQHIPEVLITENISDIPDIRHCRSVDNPCSIM